MKSMMKRSLFEKAVSINPNLWQAYQNLAFIAVAQKDYKKAMEYIEKAIAMNPTNVDLQKMREQIQTRLLENP